MTAELVAPCAPDELFLWIEDLGRYPDWLDIVPVAEPAEAHPDDPGPAWSVTLRGQMGPLARSKRLRMVRTAHDLPRVVRFERVEHDGREHAAWVLSAEVVGHRDPVAPGGDRADAAGKRNGGDHAGDHDGSGARNGREESSLLKMHLHYGGSLGGPPVRKLLADAIVQSRSRLLDRLNEGRRDSQT